MPAGMLRAGLITVTTIRSITGTEHTAINRMSTEVNINTISAKASNAVMKTDIIRVRATDTLPAAADGISWVRFFRVF